MAGSHEASQHRLQRPPLQGRGRRRTAKGLGLHRLFKLLDFFLFALRGSSGQLRGERVPHIIIVALAPHPAANQLASLLATCRRKEQGDTRSEDSPQRYACRKQTDIVPVRNGLGGKSVWFWLWNRSGRRRFRDRGGRSGRAGKIAHKSLAQGMVRNLP